MRRLLGLLAAASLLAGPPAEAAIGISKDGRRFVHADRRAFFWLGDTAWELFHRLTREEAEEYLEDRRRKGFTVIQAVVLAELGGLRVPNAYGDLPLAGNDPERPSEAYFRHIDHVVARAAAKGLHIAMLPTWGDKFNRKWGEGPEIFTPHNARSFGAWLARRYAKAPVVWVLGGDRNPETPAHLAIVRAMAEGIEAGGGARQLMTYHPKAAASLGSGSPATAGSTFTCSSPGMAGATFQAIVSPRKAIASSRQSRSSTGSRATKTIP